MYISLTDVKNLGVMTRQDLGKSRGQSGLIRAGYVYKYKFPLLHFYLS